MSQLRIVNYKAEIAGPKVLILGAVHGNEPAGTNAIEKAMKNLETSPLLKGEVTFVPICNPAAKTHNVRFIKENLNRILYRHHKANTIEQDYANQLCNLIEEHDYVLDIHSTHIKGDLPTVFNDFVTEETIKWSNYLNVGTVITSWREMLKKCEAPTDFSDTVFYAHNSGKKALLVEAGYHEDDSAESIAINCITRTFEFLNMLDKSSTEVKKNTIAHMYKVVFKTKEKGAFTTHWKHMDEVHTGDVIAKLDNGKPLVAEFDGYVVIPFPDAKAGEEWFYLAKI